jgi:hypothetical protein
VPRPRQAAAKISPVLAGTPLDLAPLGQDMSEAVNAAAQCPKDFRSAPERWFQRFVSIAVIDG